MRLIWPNVVVYLCMCRTQTIFSSDLKGTQVTWSSVKICPVMALGRMTPGTNLPSCQMHSSWVMFKHSTLLPAEMPWFRSGEVIYAIPMISFSFLHFIFQSILSILIFHPCRGKKLCCSNISSDTWHTEEHSLLTIKIFMSLVLQGPWKNNLLSVCSKPLTQEDIFLRKINKV